MHERKQVTIQLAADDWRLLERLCAHLGTDVDAWVEQLVRTRLGRPIGSGNQQTAHLRRLEAPVRSWPLMEEQLMRASTACER